MIDAEVKQSLLKNGLILFASDYGKKGVAESWTVRLSKQIKQLDQFKDFSNVNIATGGDSLIVDVDLDCPEALELADAFLNPTGMMFGRESTPRSHRLYKVIDLNKKHTRAYFDWSYVHFESHYGRNTTSHLRCYLIGSTYVAYRIS